MAFTFPVNVGELIGERASQWIGIGVPAQVIADVQSRVMDMWLDGPGGWAYEWSAAASDAEQTGELVQASLLYGIAKFPVLIGEAHRKAYANQLRTYLQAPTVSRSASNAIWSTCRSAVQSFRCSRTFSNPEACPTTHRASARRR
jgi:hypothetical protein